jgi:hypothetical protein
VAGKDECVGNIEMKTPTQQIQIDCRHQAKIIRWNAGGNDIIQRGIDRDFWLFREMSWSPPCYGENWFSVAETTERQDAVSLRMSGEMSFLGEDPRLLLPEMSQEDLKVEKTYTVSRQDGSITVDYRVINQGKHEREISWWVNGQLHLGDKFQLVLPTAERAAIVDIVGMSNPSDLMFCSADAPFAPGREQFEKESRQKENLVAGTFAVLYPGNVALVYSVEFGKLLEIYTHTEQPPTLEIIYRPMTLATNGAWETSVRVQVLHDMNLEGVRKLIR